MLHVTCAIIEHQGKVLICQRSASMKLSLKWEFPGGKVETGESKEECLKREIKEELGLEIEVHEELTAVTHAYPNFEITLYPSRCTVTDGELMLTEHAQALWVSPAELQRYDWAEADVPIVNEIMQLWS